MKKSNLRNEKLGKSKSVKNKKIREIRINLRVNDEEYLQIMEEYKLSRLSNRSIYLRKKLLSVAGGKELVFEKQQMEVLVETSKLRTEIRRVGNNFNQIVHLINTYKTIDLKPKDYKIIKELGTKIDAALSKIESLTDRLNQ